MDEVLTENQRILARYLRAVGCSKSEALAIVMRVYGEASTLEMLEYCRTHPNASRQMLLEESLRIYSKMNKEESTQGYE